MLLPVYHDMRQTGLAVQSIFGDWIYKFESIYRHSEQHYWSAVAGFEYTDVGIWGQRDLGYLLEYQGDQRDASEAIGQHDLFLGLRLSLNDADSSEVLVGVAHDLDFDGHNSWMLSASTRLNSSFKLELESWFFEGESENNISSQFSQDDLIQFRLSYYFD